MACIRFRLLVTVSRSRGTLQIGANRRRTALCACGGSYSDGARAGHHHYSPLFRMGSGLRRRKGNHCITSSCPKVPPRPALQGAQVEFRRHAGGGISDWRTLQAAHVTRPGAPRGHGGEALTGYQRRQQGTGQDSRGIQGTGQDSRGIQGIGQDSRGRQGMGEDDSQGTEQNN